MEPRYQSYSIDKKKYVTDMHIGVLLTHKEEKLYHLKMDELEIMMNGISQTKRTVLFLLL